MYFSDGTSERGDAKIAAAPSKCPACGSSDVKPSGKVVTDSSYWRCDGCGEVWNLGRRRDTAARVNRFFR
jgi:transposase-like protein